MILFVFYFWIGVTEPTTMDSLNYTYNPFGKRDPFQSLIFERGQRGPADQNPLLSYELSKFTLTGIIWGISNPKAIVVDGSGQGHVISRGMIMGVNKGKVVRILKNEVIVAEEIRNPLGQLIVNEYSLKLKTIER